MAHTRSKYTPHTKVVSTHNRGTLMGKKPRIKHKHKATVTNYHSSKSESRLHVRNDAPINLLPKQTLESTNKPIRTIQIQK